VGKGGGLSQDVQKGMLANETALVDIAKTQSQNSQQLYGEAFPGFVKAEDFYQALSSGDPYAISRAIAPSAQQITQAADAAKANILRTAPSGGERNLALEQVDVNRGAEIGSTASQAYLNSFNALAQLAGQGVGEGISSAGVGISGLSSANQGLGELGQLQIQNQQVSNESKGATLGALASLGGGLFEGAGAAAAGGGSIWSGLGI